MNLGAMWVTLGVDASGLEAATARMKAFETTTMASWNRIAQKTRTFGYLASTAISLPIIMIGKSSFQMAKDFEFSIQKIVGLAGVAQSAVNDWEKDLLEMAPRVAKSPKELAEALYFIASSGIKGSEALDVLELSAKAATSGLGETKDVADLLTSVLNAYRGTGMTAAKATDILIAAVREGKGEADAFAKSMGKVIPVSAQMGVSFDQVAGAMAAMTLAGASAANASTYLLGFLNILLKAPPAGDRVLKNLTSMKTSYSLLRQELKEKGLLSVMEHLKAINEKFGDSISSDVLPNVRGLIAEFSVAGKNLKYNSEIMTKITNSSGSLAEAFAAVSNTIKVQFDSALAQGQVSLIALGKDIAETFLPILREWVKRLEHVTTWFNSLSDVQKHNAIVIAMWAAAAGPIALIVAAVIYSVSGLITAFIKLGQIFVWAKQIILAFQAVMIENPIGLMIFAVAALTAGYFALTNKINGARSAQAGFGGEFDKSPIKKYLDALDVANATKDAIQENMMVLWGMNKKQVENESTGIEQRIASLADARKQLDIYEKTWAEKDQGYITLQKKLAFAQEQVNGWSKDHSAEGTMQKNNWAQEVTAQRKSLDEYIKNNVRFITAQRKYIDDESANEEKNKKLVDPILENIRLKDEAAKKVLQTMQEQDEAIKKAFQDLAEGEDYIARMHTLMGSGFDVNKAKIELYQKVLEDLAKTTIPLTDKGLLKIRNDLSALTGSVDEGQKVLNEFKSTVAGLDMKKAIVGPSFDANTPKLEAAQKALEDYLKVASTKIANTNFFDPFAGKNVMPILLNVQNLIDLTKQYQDLKEKEDDTKQLKFLQMQADAFGNVDAQIEVLNFEYQRSIRLMEKLAKAPGEFNEDAFKKAAADVLKYRDALQAASETKQMTFLNNMNSAFKDSAHYSDLLGGRIDILRSRMEMLSADGKGNTDMFKNYAKQIERLTFQQGVVDNLTNAFTDFFSITKDGFKDFGKFVSDWVGSVLQSFQRLIAELIAKKLVMLLLNIFTKGIAGRAGVASAQGAAAFGMAKGGTVPSGYPNDTYPALLSSGEKVIPYDKIQSQKINFEDVRFVIEQNQLVGILKKASKQNSIY